MHGSIQCCWLALSRPVASDFYFLYVGIKHGDKYPSRWMTSDVNFYVSPPGRQMCRLGYVL